MKAVQYTAPRQFVVVDLPKPELDPHQMVIRIRTCGIYRTDLTVHDGSFLAKFPLMNGREFAGVIDSAGNTVTERKVDDRVIADNTELCDYCEPCRSDKPLYCENFNSHGCNVPGGFTEYVLINRGRASVLSGKLSFEEAISTEPIACAVRGVDRIASRFGDSIPMFDVGPTGIILVQLLHRAGAGRTIIADPRVDKLNILRKYGFIDLAIMDKADPSRHTAEIKAIMPRGFDIVISAAGAASVFESCFHFVHMGSKIVAYSVYAVDAKVPASPYNISSQGYTIPGSFAQTHCFDRALEYLGNGTVQVEELISHELPLEDYGKGLDHIVQKQTRRVIIYP